MLVAILKLVTFCHIEKSACKTIKSTNICDFIDTVLKLEIVKICWILY